MINKKSEYDVAIIGAGLGGLISGAKLAKEGKSVVIIEQHFIPGGCATTFKRKDFTIEVGLHEMDGLDDADFKKEIFDELDIFNNIEFVKAPEFYKTVRGNDEFVFPDTPEAQIATLIKKFPEEERAIRKYFKKIFTMFKEIRRWPKSRIKQLLILPLAPFILPNLLTNLMTTAGDFVDKLTSNEDLKLILLANVQYYHDEPSTMSFFYYAAAQANYYRGGGHYIKGGSQLLSDHLAAFIEKNGGKIIYKNLVSEIITEGNLAVGIKYHPVKDNTTVSEIYADAIIANAAAPTVSKMLDEKNEALLNKKIGNFTNSPSILTLYLGFSCNLSEVGNENYSTFIMDEHLKSTKDLKKYIHEDISKRNIVFVDYGRIDSGLAPEGKSVGAVCALDNSSDWNDLSKDEYKAKKEEYTKIIISRLEKLYPGIGNKIEYSELSTAKTVERYTLNPGGSIYGFAQTPKQAGPLRLQPKEAVKNLYFASVWTLPGGGFTGAILAGYNCANVVLKKLK
jgi:all-trans-retinol 13,14-reductase